MRITYILDTSTLISAPSILKNLPESDVIIPIAVLNELDNLKKQPNESGKHARVCIKTLDELSKLGDIHKGVLLDNNCNLKVDVTYYSNTEQFGPEKYGDTQILMCAHKYGLDTQNYNNNVNSEINFYDIIPISWRKDDLKDDIVNLHSSFKKVILLSNDINLRVKARAFGIEAEEYVDNKFSLSDVFSGVKIIKNEILGLQLLQQGYLNYSDEITEDLFPNECAIFQDENNQTLCMGRRSRNKIKLVKKSTPWKVNPKNKEQQLAVDLLLDTSVNLVTLIGKAGTGKSLIALAAALELVLGGRDYNKLIIYRPIQPVGNDIGFLPGEMSEKLAPWFQAIMDNLEFLLGTRSDWKKELELYQKKGRIEMEAITYIRGRSIPNAVILIDECQNLSKEEVKTLLTRAGENTKIILTGDLEQIDKAELDAVNNGLIYTVEKFKNEDIAGHVTLTHGERSYLASRAAEIL